jgi:pyruvate dehydrogenase E2 component (dihydrolipoamide acetyltransferase)
VVPADASPARTPSTPSRPAVRVPAELRPPAQPASAPVSAPAPPAPQAAAAPRPRPRPRPGSSRRRRPAPQSRPQSLGAHPGAGDAQRGRHRGAVHQHPSPHRRAHGGVQGHVAARHHRRRGRLRGRRDGCAACSAPEFKAAEGFSLTYLPFISRAVVDAIEEFPYINASVGDGGLVVHRNVNLSVRSTSTSRACWPRWCVTTPTSACGDRPRHRTTSPTGPAPSSSAPTTWWAARSRCPTRASSARCCVAPIINQPQVAILSTDGITRKPVVVTDERGGVDRHPLGGQPHPVVGPPGLRRRLRRPAFLARMKEILETRDWVAEL